ncbi:MAG: hypothetical protein ACXV5I_06005 [Halobacteriota archaeon]
MSEYEKERPLQSFILPNESYKWDFTLDKYAAEDDAKREGASERQKTKRDDRFDKGYTITRRRRKLPDRHCD